MRQTLVSPTKAKALALYDAGQKGPAARVAGGASYLQQWLDERAVSYVEPPPPRERERLPGRPRGSKTMRLFSERVASKHDDLPQPDGKSLLYHVAHSRRRLEEMKRVARAIRAAAGAVIADFGVTEGAIQHADKIEGRDLYQDARAAFVAVVYEIAPDITEVEISATLGIARPFLCDIRALHRALNSSDEPYRAHFKRSLGIARSIYEGRQRASQMVAPNSTERCG